MQTAENRTSKGKSWVEYGPGIKPEKVAHKRTEPYDALEKREQKEKRKKQQEEKEAPRNVKKGRTTLKRSKWRKG